MAEKNILASAISNVEHLAAFDTMAAKRFSDLQLDKLLVYLIDIVDVSALPFLADQFDVLGYKGMRLATTEAQQREVIKRAIELKRYAGTPWAIEEALKAIGYPNAELIENAGTGDTGWAQFRINLNIGDKGLSASEIDELIQMINIYKNKRSHLLDLTYQIDYNDEAITITDSSDENQSDDGSDSFYTGGGFIYDGSVLYNGSKNYSDDSDVITITII